MEVRQGLGTTRLETGILSSEPWMSSAASPGVRRSNPPSGEPAARADGTTPATAASIQHAPRPRSVSSPFPARALPDDDRGRQGSRATSHAVSTCGSLARGLPIGLAGGSPDPPCSVGLSLPLSFHGRQTRIVVFLPSATSSFILHGFPQINLLHI